MKLRIVKSEDAKQIIEIYAPYVLNTDISFETIVPSREEMQGRITAILAKNPWIVLEENDYILGYAYASKHRERSAYRWAVDISIYVRQECRGRGIGKALYTALISILKLQGYYNVYAGICLPNEASIGIHESFGFRKMAHYTKVGYKAGHWLDTGWWELSLKEHNAAPVEPLPFNKINQDEIQRILLESIGGE